MNFYRLMIPRLNGKDIGRDFDYYRRLVRNGVAGFIVFGGELEKVRGGIRELQAEAKKRLIIASDLEQGLGQQVEGGTLFPPAMAIAAAIKKNSKFKIQNSKLRILRNAFKAIALEARYAGMNTVFAPVLDINTNPKNPIISTRAFGEDKDTVSFFGCEMIRTLQSNGVAACGKHFPGHGDTEIDSHIGLPVIKRSMRSLGKTELVPFINAVKQGVEMIMLGHLSVPALDASGIPVSLSKIAVKYLRDKMKFKGIIITDALNMGGIGRFSEEEASLMALKAGVDMLLHPTNPDRVADYLGRKLSAFSRQSSAERLLIKKATTSAAPDFERNRRLAEEIALKAIRIDGKLKPLKNPFLIILSDDAGIDCKILINKLRIRKYLSLKEGDWLDLSRIPEESELVVAVFSKVKAWKGGASPWLLRYIKKLEGRAGIFISFGSPYLLDTINKAAAKIYAYWDSDIAQKAVAKMI